MRELTVPKLPKWPFFAGDLFLLGSAFFIQAQSVHPLGLWQLGLLALCVGAGTLLAALPFVLEYRAAVRLAEAGALASTVEQIKKLEAVAGDIKTATGLWQNAQDAADKTALSAQAIADRMAAEAKSFMEFMERANLNEKAALRLEVEKFRRAEAEWMQVLVRVLDHVYALHQGALKSGQPNLVEQMSRFQRACYEAARRIGLTPFVALPAEPFNEERHQSADGTGKPPTDSRVEETLANGYTYQGRIARPALVRLRGGSAEAPRESGADPGQDAGPPGRSGPEAILNP
jgi:molecular chaperone GrpE (heat shock protein)